MIARRRRETVSGGSPLGSPVLASLANVRMSEIVSIEFYASHRSRVRNRSIYDAGRVLTLGAGAIRVGRAQPKSVGERADLLRIRARGLSQLLTASTRQQPLPRSGRDWCPYTLPGALIFAPRSP